MDWIVSVTWRVKKGAKELTMFVRKWDSELCAGIHDGHNFTRDIPWTGN